MTSNVYNKYVQMAAMCICLLCFCFQNSRPKVSGVSVQMVKIEGGKSWYSFSRQGYEHLCRLDTYPAPDSALAWLTAAWLFVSLAIDMSH